MPRQSDRYNPNPNQHNEDTFSKYQKWTKSHEKLSILSGPFSFVGSTSGGFAIGVVDGKCAIEMALTTQVGEDTSLGQQFYLGSGGSIHSTKCPGLVIAMDTIDCIGGQLTFQTTTGEARCVYN